MNISSNIEKNSFEENQNSNSKWDNIFSKYSTIWIWSIIVSLNSGLTFTFANYRIPHWNFFSLILFSVYASAVFFSIKAWNTAYAILHQTILPHITGQTISQNTSDIKKINSNDTEEYMRQIEKKKYTLLSIAFRYLIYAISFKMGAFLLEQLLNALSLGQ